jgi:iron-sulfur cluster protein
MRIDSLKGYHQAIKESLEDSYLRDTLGRFYEHSKGSRDTIFKGLDWEKMVAEVSEMKDSALSRIEELYAEFYKQATSKGAIVHRCQDASECNELVKKIARENDVHRIVKSKSMTSEEIGLNHALVAAGLEVTETDLGEFIVQLRREGPSHMVLPAIHLSRGQVSDIFTKSLGTEESGDIEALVKVARESLRPKFFAGDMGITGANFAISQSGTLGICTNEGNARLVSTLPKVHVAILGLDKLTPSLDDALKILDVLPRNATGQNLTTYVSFISGAQKFGEGDEIKKLHIIFLDNGRKALLKDPICSEVLRCVRCGACANICPVYRMIGGHKMGYIYIGAVGLILTYFFHGKDLARHLIHNCIACEACRGVCAAGIDLPKLILEVRSRLAQDEGIAIEYELLSLILPHRRLFRGLISLGRMLQGPFESGGSIRHLPFFFSKDHSFRSLPKIADKPFRDIFPKLPQGESKPAKLKVGIFAGCAHDFILPEELVAGVKVMQRKGASLSFPQEQTCCGLPAMTLGKKEVAVKTALSNLEAFKGQDLDYIVTLCPSCANFLKNRYLELLTDYPEKEPEIKAFTEKVIDFSSLMRNVLKLEAADLSPSAEKAGYHSSCHLIHALKVSSEPRELLGLGASYVKTPLEDLCCGFGGLFSLKYPEESASLIKEKLDIYERAGVNTVVTDCPGCVIQLRGGSERRGRPMQAEHMAVFLERHLAPEE